MHIDAQTEKLLEQTVGVTSIETKEGIEAFYNAWSLNKASIICLAGDFKKIKASVENKASNPKKEEGVEVTTKEGITIEQVAHYLKGILSQDIKLPVQRIDSDAGMEEYGIDSLMVMQLTSHLEEIFGALPKTLFFEYQTVRELSGYFLKEHKETLSKLLNVAATKKTPPVKEMQGKEESVSEVKGSKRGNRHRRYVANHYDIGPNENEDIAIVGMAGKYPKSDNLKEYWDNLRNGVDCITEIPKERWDGDLLFDPDKNKQGSIYCKWGGFINGVNEFDPLFFNIAPREAEIMEPQERLFLQCVYHTLEDAGYTPQQVRNLQKGNSGVGVYVGVMYEEYQLYGAQHQMKGHQIALSGNPSSIANRISYYCNFNGPSMAIDTMCSSSLTAVHLACRSILQGECEAAIAGGVNVSVHPNKYVMLSQGKFASSKGRCESFGEGGDGYVPGEGVGAIMLKKLSKAVEDGDHIYGVIKATTINHGGRTNGYTVPNPNAQRNLISKALYEAHIDPRTISYIEAHGTGTSLGDPIEITGLSQAFGEYTKDKQFCAIGSAKSNIGHCESAAGIAGITKVLLQMKYKEIVPSIHSKILNPYIDFEKTPFVVQQELTPWKKPIIKENGKDVEYPRRAGISAFGAGGSNAHIIIEEYEDNKEVKTNQLDEFVIILSAKTEEQLNQKVQDLRNEIDKYSNEDLMNIAYTLQVGREDMEYRLAFTTSNVAEVKEKLTKFINNDLSADVIYTGRAKKNSSSLKKIMNDEDMKNAIETWIIKRKYDKLISLWLKGIKIDWRKMYVGAAPQKISLPTYPFAKEVYWVPKGERQNGTLSSRQSTIHPFISENTSNFMTQKFTTHFDRQQAYLEDKGAYSIVPLVVQLEMARIASKLSMETVDGKAVLHNIHIYKPIEVTDVFNQLDTKLYIESDGDIAWELYSQSDESGDTLCCEGRTSYVIDSEDEVLDLKQSHYIQFNVANKTIWVNEIQEGEGKIFIEFNQEANEALQGYKEQVVIEPTMYKECMQSIGEYLGIMMQTEFIESIVINKESSSHSVLVEFNLGQSNLDLNMTWYDHEKHVTTKMIGMQCTINEEVSDKSKQALVPEESAIYETMAFTEEWQETEAVMGNDLVKRIVIFVESLEYKQNISNELMVYEEDIQLIFVAPGEKYHKYAEDEYEIAAHKKEDYIQCLETVQNKWPQVDSIMYLWALNNKQYAIDETEIIYTLQALAKSKLDAKRLLIVGGYSDEITRCHIESWIGIERSIKMVLPAVKVNVVCMRNEDLSWHKCINLLYKELRSKEESVWFDHNIRKTCHLREVQLENEVQHMLKKQGVYIITGGLGGLGKMFAKYLMTTYDAKLALIGRSKEEVEKLS
ncbi:beta-ketoacyl synthase N-terminal-like domain-containing protein [Cellulosilyticum ruminicola]|uniref:beta-ketoacyl synthase N-terminal-like domain-containing protein n=1 Tax=Cellulosilyticum ruminicola TaxID=425254 RepID=UPI0006D0717F